MLSGNNIDSLRYLTWSGSLTTMGNEYSSTPVEPHPGSNAALVRAGDNYDWPGSSYFSNSTITLTPAYVPTGTSDAIGNVGDITWDAGSIYVKTGTGWKKAALSTF
jgi:hypothetical protein